jgi:hypothetical protein
MPQFTTMGSSTFVKVLFFALSALEALAQCQHSVDPISCSRLSSECLLVTSQCAPTISSCAYSYCALCTDLGILPAIEPCCAAPTQTACFDDLLAGQPLSQTGNFATITNQPAPPACQSVESIIDSCTRATPGFTELEFSSQFTCLCSKNGVYAPLIYDEYTSTCLAYLSSVSPAVYLSIGGQINGTDIYSHSLSGFRYESISIPDNWSSFDHSCAKNPVYSSDWRFFGWKDL